MNDFRTTCGLFSREYFGEELTTEKISRADLADVVGYSTHNAPYEARIAAVEAVISDLNNRGVDTHDTYLLNIKEVYNTLKSRDNRGDLTIKLRNDIDQNFKNFLKGVDGSDELSNLL
jgi:hypothetical protein